jgi:hypothetical protein
MREYRYLWGDCSLLQSQQKKYLLQIKVRKKKGGEGEERREGEGSEGREDIPSMGDNPTCGPSEKHVSPPDPTYDCSKYSPPGRVTYI